MNLRFASILASLSLVGAALGQPARFCMTEDEHSSGDSFWTRNFRVPSLEDAGGMTTAHAVAVKSLLWPPGQDIRVRFLGGDASVVRRVRATAEQWTQHANLRFSWVDSGPSHVRVGFDPGGSWSRVGTDCAKVAQSEATMNFGWFDRATPDRELRRTTLHEFGHAIGLSHEHMSPAVTIRWNEPVVLADMARQGWSADQTRRNIFDRLGRTTTRSSAFDPDSIMAYSVPARWTLDGFSLEENADLSATDRQFVGQLYPFPAAPPRPTAPPPRPSPPPPTPAPAAAVALELGNTASPAGTRGVWNWTAFVRGPGLERVTRVTYHLHPTFRPDVVTVDSGPGFPFRTSGWGTFRLRAVAQLDDGSSRRLEHDLVFREGLPGPVAPPTVAPPRPPSAPRLGLSNVARPTGQRDAAGRQLWSWTAFLTGDDVARVHHVVYLLHPSFRPSEYRVERGAGPQLPFTASGWGTFTLRARAALDDGRVVSLSHPLRFR